MYESCDVPREEELRKDESEAELKASIDSTTSKHYSHDDWLKALYDVMKDPRWMSRIMIENIRRSLDDE